MSRTVMVVEDNELLVGIYKALVALLDCRLIHARTVKQALELLATVQPDLVVLDLRLPDGTGIEVIRAIRAREEFKTIPIVTVTTGALNLQSAAHDAGSTLFLLKPVSTDELTAVLRRYLGSDHRSGSRPSLVE
jgi:two-component system cell cycle response regulator DivK